MYLFCLAFNDLKFSNSKRLYFACLIQILPRNFRIRSLSNTSLVGDGRFGYFSECFFFLKSSRNDVYNGATPIKHLTRNHKDDHILSSLIAFGKVPK